MEGMSSLRTESIKAGGAQELSDDILLWKREKEENSGSKRVGGTVPLKIRAGSFKGNA